MRCLLSFDGHSMSSGTYSLKTTPKDGFLRNFSLQSYLLPGLLPLIGWKEIVDEIFFNFQFRGIYQTCGLTSYKPT